MDQNNYTELSDGWDSDDEDELVIQSSPPLSCLNMTSPGQASIEYGEASTSGSARSKLIDHFVRMGFGESLVVKAINENGEDNTELVLETLLAYSVLDNSLPDCEPVPLDIRFPEIEKDSLDGLSDSDSCLGNEEDPEHFSEEEKKFLHLVEMGFPAKEVQSALDACGPSTSITDLMDFISASEIATTTNCHLEEPPHLFSHDGQSGSNHYHADTSDSDHYADTPNNYHADTPILDSKKRKKLFEEEERWGSKQDSWRRREKESYKNQKKKKQPVHEDEETVRLPKPMVGFGLPYKPALKSQRTLPEAAIGPPYFYYENVACTPKGVWSTISRFLYDIEPEFVDSVHFSAAARKRGYIHNLPLNSRFPLVPIPPQTIQEVFPLTKNWWPSWDPRTKFNCLNTCIASAKLTERIRKVLESWEGDPPLKSQKYVLYQCRKWNLVWIGKNKVAPLEPDEIEMLLGYPKDHTRGGGTNRTDRYKSLGNSFQVDTVAFHLSVLKSMFPTGVTVLSLFSGIGGAEVALHRLGIPLKNVVSVEISEVNRNILRSWWEQTYQKGNLIHIEDVQKLTADKLEQLINTVGGFDLIIGGSPCNNLTGSNRWHRDGLEGEHSVLFYDYFRILDTVKCIMGNN